MHGFGCGGRAAVAKENYDLVGSSRLSHLRIEHDEKRGWRHKCSSFLFNQFGSGRVLIAFS